MHLTILTGASRGLGAAMAEQLLKNGHRLLTLSRHTADLWVVQGSDLDQWAVDLVDASPWPRSWKPGSPTNSPAARSRRP